MISRCDNCRLPTARRNSPKPADWRFSSRRGFTAIELLTVMGIMVILGSLIFIGLRQVTGTTKATATRTTLANMRSMLDALRQANELKDVPGRWWWTDASHASPQEVHVQNSTDGCDFWRNPHRDDDDSAKPVRPLVAPSGALLADNGQRHVSDAVRNTGLAMVMLANVTTNKNAMQQLPTDQNALAMVQWNSTTAYAVGQRVWHMAPSEPPRFYACIQAHTNQTPGSGSDYWQETFSTLLDAWGHPIIFVPAAGLQVTGSSTVVTSAGTIAYDSATWPPAAARPFFASPGEDGDFAKTDDNIYSFEN